MITVTFDTGLFFNSFSTSVTGDFFLGLQGGTPTSRHYNVVENTPDEWLVQFDPSRGVVAEIAFLPVTTFVPGSTSLKAPPAGPLETIVVYDASGAEVARFDHLDEGLNILGPDDRLTVGAVIAMPWLITGGANLFTGSDANDLFFGDAGDDYLYGQGGNDILLDGDGDDHLFGGDGDDLLAGGGNGDHNVLDGGAGTDIVLYGAGSYVDLAAGHYSDAAGSWDTFISIEGLQGANYADTFFGDEGANVLQGMGGDDTLIGRGGADDIQGGDGNDWLDGGDGDDILAGGAGVNVLNGGAGTDLASYADITTGVYVDLSVGVYSNGAGRWDAFNSIEGLSGGAGNDTLFAANTDSVLKGLAGDDILVGRGGNDTLDGGAGNDWLVGGDGDDHLFAGGGTDVMTGGPGSDIFDMAGATGEWAVAFDFTVGTDHIVLGNGQQFLGFVAGDYDLNGDGQFDTLLGWANGNFVALGVHGLTLDQWNATLV